VLIAGGGTITVSGTVTRDLILGGRPINVTGHVGGSIKIAAGGNINGETDRSRRTSCHRGMIERWTGATNGRRPWWVAGAPETVSAPIARRVQIHRVA